MYKVWNISNSLQDFFLTFVFNLFILAFLYSCSKRFFLDIWHDPKADSTMLQGESWLDTIFDVKIENEFLRKNFLLYLTIFHLAGNIIKACQSLGCHILDLESNMEVFTEVLKPLIEVATTEADIEHVHSFDIDFPIKKRLRRLFDYE